MQIPLWQRLLAPLVYLLPWSDAIPFGLGADGVFNQIPLLRLLIVPAVPLIQLDRTGKPSPCPIANAFIVSDPGMGVTTGCILIGDGHQTPDLPEPRN